MTPEDISLGSSGVQQEERHGDRLCNNQPSKFTPTCGSFQSVVGEAWFLCPLPRAEQLMTFVNALYLPNMLVGVINIYIYIISDQISAMKWGYSRECPTPVPHSSGLPYNPAAWAFARRRSANKWTHALPAWSSAPLGNHQQHGLLLWI